MVLNRVFNLDYRSINFYRYFIAIILIVDISIKFLNVEIFYSQEGLFPVFGDLASIFDIFHNLFFIGKGLFLTKIKFIMGLICCVLFLSGRYTKVSAILIWYFYNSLLLRNTIVIHSAEEILRVLCFWNIFLPFHKKSTDKASIAEVFFTIQVVVIYLVLMFQRDYSAWAETGTAMVWVFNSHVLTSPIGSLLSSHYGFLESISKVMYWFEFLIPPLIFMKPIRGYIVFLMILFHFSIFVFFNIGVFPFIGIALWIPFISSRFWENRWVSRLRLFYQEPIRKKDANKFFKYLSTPIMLIGMIQMFHAFFYTGTLKHEGYESIYNNSFLKSSEEIFKVNQQWGMFTPTPRIMNGWHNVEVVKDDNQSYDLVSNEKYDRMEISYFDMSHKLAILMFTSDDQFLHYRQKYLSFYCSKLDNAKYLKMNYTYKDEDDPNKNWKTVSLAEVKCQD